MKLVLEESFFDFKKIDEPFLYFETEEFESPTITLIMNETEEKLYTPDTVFREYHIGKNVITFQKKYGRSSYKVTITGLDENDIKIYFRWIKKSLKDRLIPNYLPQLFIVEPLIEFVLLKKGYLLMHSGAASNPNGAILLAGRSGSYKTPLLTELINKYNFSFIADDKLIINDEMVYSFPKNLHLFTYLLNKKNNLSEFNQISEKIRCLLSSRNGKCELKIWEKDSVKTVIFLIKSKTNHLKVMRIEKEKAIEMLIYNTIAEFWVSNHVWGALMAYSYAHENFIYPEISLIRQAIKRLLNGCDTFYSAIIPADLDEKRMEHLMEEIIQRTDSSSK